MDRLFEPRSERDLSPEPPAYVRSSWPSDRSRRRRKILTRVLVGLLATTLVLTTAGFAVALWLQHSYNDNIQRFGDPFAALPAANRPAGAVGAVNVLLLGSDSRISADNPRDWLRGAQRTDAVMIAHIPAGRSRITIASLPKDESVTIPGHGRHPLNEALSLGGPTLMVETVEAVTNVRISHLIILDFEGLQEITDDLGGVTLAGATGATGSTVMNGATALRYIRAPQNVPGEDTEQVRRQQAWIRAVALRSLTPGTVQNPIKLNSVLDSLTRSISADEGFSIQDMRSLAFSLRKVDGNDLNFVTVGFGPTAGRFWAAMAADRIPA